MTANPALLFKGFTRRLGIEPEEQRLLFLMGALVATLFCAYTIAKVLRDALFLGEFGALALPYAYIGVAMAAVGFVWLESIVARRFALVGATRFNQYARSPSASSPSSCFLERVIGPSSASTSGPAVRR